MSPGSPRYDPEERLRWALRRMRQGAIEVRNAAFYLAHVSGTEAIRQELAAMEAELLHIAARVEELPK